MFGCDRKSITSHTFPAEITAPEVPVLPEETQELKVAALHGTSKQHQPTFPYFLHPHCQSSPVSPTSQLQSPRSLNFSPLRSLQQWHFTTPVASISSRACCTGGCLPQLDAMTRNVIHTKHMYAARKLHYFQETAMFGTIFDSKICLSLMAVTNCLKPKQKI